MVRQANAQRRHTAGCGMIYGSVCSGIEAASVAWHPLGWRPAFLSEIEPFPRAVLAHHHPAAPLHGDFTTIQAEQYVAINLLVGGTPCQSFSVAGLRGGMADERGNLALEYLRLAKRLRPRWLVWENVPGVLSSNRGRDFGSFLGGLGQLGYGFAYRVLDAQYFGLAQRRKRVFVVGYLGDWRPSAAVLFEPESLRWHPAPSREAGKAVAALTANDVGTCGADDNQAQAGHLIAYTLRGDGFDASEDGTRRGTPLIVALQGSMIGRSTKAGPSGKGYDTSGACFTLTKTDHHAVSLGSTVRRLTPRECERLQGFPDDYTAITYRGKPAADGNRYKALGNSMAVPCMAWIGKRIADVDASI